MMEDASPLPPNISIKQNLLDKWTLIEKNYQKWRKPIVCIYILVHVPPINMEEEGFMTNCPAHHQGDNWYMTSLSGSFLCWLLVTTYSNGTRSSAADCASTCDFYCSHAQTIWWPLLGLMMMTSWANDGGDVIPAEITHIRTRGSLSVYLHKSW